MKTKVPTIVFCATRQKDISEAEISINSIREIYPDIEIILFTNIESYTNPRVNSVHILKNQQNNFLDKISTLLEVKRKRILFLDGDTFLIKNIDELFALLNNFDLAVAHAPNRWTFKINEVPDSFPEFNTGVLLLNKNYKIRRLLKNWYNDYKKYLDQKVDFPSKDQPSFRKCLFLSKIRFSVLTPEYNCRFTMGAMVSHNVKLLHGRTNDFSKIKKSINDAPINQWSDEPKLRWIKYE
ncbi:MAG: glycosyltransferase [Fulvivirga sp.]|uniref:glycosyltransferase n=1 Tax=Fulvivirga sp. TaxID=1931237 RepID=UPI0032EC0BAA